MADVETYDFSDERVDLGSGVTLPKSWRARVSGEQDVPGTRAYHDFGSVTRLPRSMRSSLMSYASTSAIKPTIPGHRRFAKKTVDLGSHMWYLATKGD